MVWPCLAWPGLAYRTPPSVALLSIRTSAPSSPLSHLPRQSQFIGESRQVITAQRGQLRSVELAKTVDGRGLVDPGLVLALLLHQLQLATGQLPA